MDIWVNTADIGGNPPIRINDHTQPVDEDGSDIIDGDATGRVKEFAQMSLPLNEEIASALVERCGDKRYWKSWAVDVGEVVNRIRSRIETLLDRTDRPDITEAFDQFLKEMQRTINNIPGTLTNLVGMIACHLVTLPVFDALFGSDKFSQHNPVVKALTKMTDTLDDEGLINEAART